MPSAVVFCPEPSCKQKSNTQLIAAHIMSHHKDLLKSYMGNSVQSKSYSVLTLGDDKQLLCCFGCKSSWFSTNLANKHRNAQCEVSHQDFLTSIDTVTETDRLADALAQNERLRRQLIEYRDITLKAKSELEIYDQLKSQQRFSLSQKEHAIEKYIEEFQKVLKPVFYQDVSGVKLLAHFKTADQNVKKNFDKEGNHIHYSKVIERMEKIKEDNPYLQAALFPSYQLYMTQYHQSGTKNYINGSTWLDDEFRHFKIKFPDYENFVYKNKPEDKDTESESESEPDSEPEPPKNTLPTIPERRSSFKAYTDEPPKIIMTTRRPSLKS